MFEQAVAASLLASVLSESLSLSGKEVYRKVDSLISQSESEVLTEEFKSALSNSPHVEETLSGEEFEALIDPVNEIAVSSFYQRREEIAEQVAFQLSSSQKTSEGLLEEDAKEIVEEALEEAVNNWFDRIKGTETADRFLLEITWETESHVKILQEKLETLIDDDRQTEWYTRIDVDCSDNTSKRVSRELGSSRPTTTEIYVNRPEIPEKLVGNKHLIVGRRGMGKTKTLEQLQTKLLREREIDHVIIPKDSFVGQEDAREFSNEDLQGDVLLVWDDIHGMRPGEQGATVRETILRLSDILEGSENSLYVLASVRSEFKDDIIYLNRPTDRVWKDFNQIELEPLDEDTVVELTEHIINAEGLEIEKQACSEIALEIWYSDPSPLYVESVISTLDFSDDIAGQIANLSQDVSGIWEEQYNQLKSEHPKSRFLLWGTNLLRMAAIPLYEKILKGVFTDVFGQDRFDFDQQVEVLLESQWIWEAENRGVETEETVYDIRGAQLSAIDENREDIMKRFSEFLLESLSKTVPEEESYWIPHYHSNLAMSFMHEMFGETRSLAEPHLKRADELAPFNAPVQNNYASFLLIDGRPEEALDHFEKALAVAPGWASLRNTYATTLDELGRPYDALEQYKKCINSEQPQPKAHFNLGTLYTELGNYHQARIEFEKALTKGYHVESVYCNLGTLLWASGEYLQGQEILEKGIEIFPESKDIRCNLTGLLWELEYPERAHEILKPLIEEETDKNDARVHGHLAKIHSDLGNQDLMEKHANIAEHTKRGENPLGPDFLDEVEAVDITQREDRESTPDLLRVINALINDGNYSKAWKRSQELLNQGYESSEFHRKLGDIAEELDKDEKAERHYKNATDLNPDNSKAFHHYGNFLKHQGRQDEAREQFDHAIEGSKSPTIFNDFGLLLFQNGEYEAAEDMFKRGIKKSEEEVARSPKIKRLYHNYGNLLFYTGNIEEADNHYEQALAHDPEYANAKFGLAQVKAEENNFDEACNLFEEAITRHAEEGQFENWSTMLISYLNVLSENEEYERAAKQCEYGIQMAQSLGQEGQMLAKSLEAQKLEYEAEL